MLRALKTDDWWQKMKLNIATENDVVWRCRWHLYNQPVRQVSYQCEDMATLPDVV